jgi:hypothetical protein
LEADEEVAADQLETGFDQKLLGEGVTDLDGRSFRRRVLVELRRGENAGPPDPIATCRRTDQNDDVPRTFSTPMHQPVLDHTQTCCVDERILRVAVLKQDLAADGWDTDRVPVGRDPVNDSVQEIARARVVKRAEPQRVQKCDRTGAHREDVANDPSDSGRGPAEGLDEGRVVV